jgi:hypothetical protein
MASRVGPAVTTMRLPVKRPGAGNSACKTAWGSLMRPGPMSPHAWSPLSGPMNWTPRARKRSILSRVAGWAHIAWFIAGATNRGACDARHKVVSKSSASPAEILARKSAVAGAISRSSAQRASSMWPIAAS